MAINGPTAANANEYLFEGKTAEKSKETASADRFLKLLVAQMQNQDPLNPMDNAQVTSQMAQINTVSGIEKLNGTVASLSSQFTRLQTLQGASLVGRDVIVPGQQFDIAEGMGQGGFQLSSAADAVTVEVLNGAGRVVDTLKLGAQSAGMHSFDWKVPEGATDASYTFRVAAKSGTTTLSTVALMRDRVGAVSLDGEQMKLELQKSGSVAYDQVKAFN